MKKDISSEFSFKRAYLGFLALRLFMALISRSWHVPDETWQSVEVSTRLLSGNDVIDLTWEWRPEVAIRSHLHPILFAPALMAADFIFPKGSSWNMEASILLPRMTQALLSALGDAAACSVCLRHFGPRALRFFMAVYPTSWFLNYCSSRPLVNSFEAALTSIALMLYPTPYSSSRKESPRWLRGSYAAVAALSFVVRPTAALFWVVPVAHRLNAARKKGHVLDFFSLEVSAAFASFASCCLIDSALYGWSPTVVPWNFFRQNVLKDVASFYGTHTWHWYLSSGLPVVLGGFGVPFLVLGFWRRVKEGGSSVAGILCQSLAVVLLSLSLVPHKEFRFLLPVLPVCWCLVADAMQEREHWVSRRTVLMATSLVFFPATLYLSLVHQTGMMSAVSWLGRLPSTAAPAVSSALFLSPCHPAPRWSHMRGREGQMRVRLLGCEPDLDRDPDYEDEADEFYKDPSGWLGDHFQSEKGDELPTHLVMFDELEPKIPDFLKRGGYSECADFFHTHFPEGRVSRRVKIFCRQKE